MSMGLHLVGRVAGRAVAFAASDVESVVDLGPVTPTPRAAHGVIGLAALRSRVATVVDPRARLGLALDDDDAPQARGGGRAVVGSIDGHLYAVRVEALEDVAEYETFALPPGVALERGWAEAGSALIDRDGEPVLVVAMAALVPHPSAPTP